MTAPACRNCGLASAIKRGLCWTCFEEQGRDDDFTANGGGLENSARYPMSGGHYFGEVTEAQGAFEDEGARSPEEEQ